ncbi:PTS transporter subunit EIIC [Tepidibacter formicigenes]|jgi:PTS system sucrose-specific IIC component|uniref:PTS system IIB component, Glc family /PTS system IIC component, Glc family n=1 Tax=Tepidibacter formicigenes DSM 15518 TaxID=1123349 RepID=A0A1M6LD00_9FIRM|nr:PTS transporter subunit EIIC [Tepidibacter formicigenes]SHJ68935.1 PTS system IIB component, Glc family /PTS system IIC component, Glc family [Tepidibacter formicigenes DSM 15518]
MGENSGVNPKQIALEIIKNIGGSENISSIEHCATRLRVTLIDDEKADIKSLKKIEGIFSVRFRIGQLHMIIGTGLVNKVHKELNDIVKKNETKNNKQNIKKTKNINYIMNKFANIFIPLIPALVGGGMLMGINYIFQRFGLISNDNYISKLLSIFSSSAFVFLNILVGFTSAKEFGGTPILGAAMAGVLIHPRLEEININKGSGGIIAVLLVIYFMSFVEKKLRKVIPEVLDLILTPLITILITGFATMYILYPIGEFLTNIFLEILNLSLEKGGAMTGFFLGGVYSTIVTTGLHQGLNAFYLEILARTGENPMLPIFAMGDTAQAGAGFAVYLYAKNKSLKKIAANSIPVCLLGITEPIMFGVNLLLVRPFIGAAIGGAIGGGFIAFFKVPSVSLGLSTIPIISIIKQGYVVKYIVGFIIAFLGAFIATTILGFDESKIED